MATPTFGMYIFQKEFILITKNAAIKYVYGKWSTQGTTKVVRRKHIIQPTGYGAYSSTCF